MHSKISHNQPTGPSPQPDDCYAYTSANLGRRLFALEGGSEEKPRSSARKYKKLNAEEKSIRLGNTRHFSGIKKINDECVKMPWMGTERWSGRRMSLRATGAGTAGGALGVGG